MARDSEADRAVEKLMRSMDKVKDPKDPEAVGGGDILKAVSDRHIYFRGLDEGSRKEDRKYNLRTMKHLVLNAKLPRC